MINIENVTRRYGDFAAVDQVSFSISQGEIVGLLGHNGAGKTTILKMLTGYLEPTEGSITIDGSDIIKNRQQVQSNIGYLPENCPVYPDMTVLDYLDYAASLHGVAEKDRNELLIDALTQTALLDRAHQSLATLSRGYRQRTGVAQAILHRPKILVLDEPTNGLDPTQILQMRELIRRLGKEATVIISTHILQEVQAVCDRVIIIKNGHLALDTKLDSLQSGSRLFLATDAPQNSVKNTLEVLTGVDFIEESGGTYALTLAHGSDRNTIAAAAAAAVQEKGWPLYSLYYETRDLETVFAEIHAQ